VKKIMDLPVTVCARCGGDGRSHVARVIHLGVSRELARSGGAQEGVAWTARGLAPPALCAQSFFFGASALLPAASPLT